MHLPSSSHPTPPRPRRDLFFFFFLLQLFSTVSDDDALSPFPALLVSLSFLLCRLRRRCIFAGADADTVKVTAALQPRSGGSLAASSPAPWRLTWGTVISGLSSRAILSCLEIANLVGSGTSNKRRTDSTFPVRPRLNNQIMCKNLSRNNSNTYMIHASDDTGTTNAKQPLTLSKAKLQIEATFSSSSFSRMQPPKSRNGNDSTFRGDKLMFIPPGALGKGCAQIDLRSFYSLRPSTSQSESILSLWKKRILEKNQGKLKRNVRGKNKCKEVAKLKSGKKLGVKFYNKRVVGKNHRVFSRHLGRIVRDRNICPLRVHSWKEIGDEEKEYMWVTVTAASKHNSSNRAKLTMPHRTGSKPIRQGGKVGQPPSLATIFFETRKKGGNLVGEDTIKQYEKIVTATQSGPSSSNIELVEECFGPQRHNHIICHGDGLKPNDLKTIGTRAELQAKLHETQKENDSLKSRMDERKPK
uniref:Transposase Tnp1/En/Spm-like domain-containing protein n=1 Tax=Ananas comosus var. bracteatus TaxID=296719 RepID=A0A6V7NWV8_ANACO|nr:unnamed protein product [Ananas comosus var. bracteatus]